MHEVNFSSPCTWRKKLCLSVAIFFIFSRNLMINRGTATLYTFGCTWSRRLFCLRSVRWVLRYSAFNLIHRLPHLINTRLTPWRLFERCLLLCFILIMQLYFLCDFDRASSLICGNKMPTRYNRAFFIADLIACSTGFGHHYAHHQELKSIIQ